MHPQTHTTFCRACLHVHRPAREDGYCAQPLEGEERRVTTNRHGTP